MLEVILATYILGVVLIGGLWGIVMWRTGGFQGFADLANKLTGLKVKYTSTEVQWYTVIITLAWPVLILLFLGLRRRS